VQDDMNLISPMGFRVLGNPHGCLPDRCVINAERLRSPTLISMLVDVAVVASKVTSAAYFQDILTYRSRHPKGLILRN
jgi:hypothetical protein